MLVAPCPECYSLDTEFDAMADEDLRTGRCRDCGKAFAPAETIVVQEGDVQEGPL
jgi:uncharacterized OB-fold protein